MGSASSQGLISTASPAPGGAPSNQGKMPQAIRKFLETLDDQEWQSSLFTLLQNQTFNQVEVDLFELMCKVLDQNLFAQVDWARNSFYFKELKVGNQPVKKAEINQLVIMVFMKDCKCMPGNSEQV